MASTLPSKSLSRPASVWSKTTLNTGSVEGAEADLHSGKT